MLTGVISDLTALEDFKGVILNIVSLDDNHVSQDVDCYTTVKAFLCSSSPHPSLGCDYDL